jgi:hypothetical protein
MDVIGVDKFGDDRKMMGRNRDKGKRSGGGRGRRRVSRARGAGRVASYHLNEREHFPYKFLSSLI